jgi:hypothetical protein
VSKIKFWASHELSYAEVFCSGNDIHCVFVECSSVTSALSKFAQCRRYVDTVLYSTPGRQGILMYSRVYRRMKYRGFWLQQDCVLYLFVSHFSTQRDFVASQGEFLLCRGFQVSAVKFHRTCNWNKSSFQCKLPQPILCEKSAFRTPINSLRWHGSHGWFREDAGNVAQQGSSFHSFRAKTSDKLPLEC